MILFVILLVLIGHLAYVKWKQTTWQRKGLTCLPLKFYIGNVEHLLNKTKSISEHALDLYRSLKPLNRTHGGFYFFFNPFYMPIDPALIKSILTKDFHHFMSHGVYHHPKDILTMNLFNIDGQEWKFLRTKLTPTFTSGKMKMMFETLVEKVPGLEKLVEGYVEKHEAFAIKDIVARFTTDIIGSCAFGLDCNSLEEPDNDFRKYGAMIFTPSKFKVVLLQLLPPNLIGNSGYKFHGEEVTRYFSNVVMETIKSREANETFRKDFMHLLLQLKNRGVSSDSASFKSEGKTGGHTLTVDEIIAQCFIFFLAGFETSSTATTFALLCLSQNPELQEKLRQEIRDELNKNDGDFTYDSIMSMPYLDKVVNETLRRYPPVAVLPRKCTKSYKVPNTDIVIDKGTSVFIPVWGIHMDPEYYPNPEVFDPERFNPEEVAKRPDFTFLPFGEGPRMCIGLRFGLMQTKVALVALLRNFRFTLNKNTASPIRMTPGIFINTVKGEVWLDATKI